MCNGDCSGGVEGSDSLELEGGDCFEVESEDCLDMETLDSVEEEEQCPDVECGKRSLGVGVDWLGLLRWGGRDSISSATLVEQYASFTTITCVSPFSWSTFCISK